MLILAFWVQAQRDIIPNIGNRSLPTAGQATDSFEKRDKFADSITITFRYLDSSRTNSFDTSISDFYQRYPIPYTYHYLGNPGAAAHSILFAPREQAGWDPGLHAYEVYKFHMDKARFFNTTRPYTELGYVLGSQTQQFIEILHTQNLKPYWNASFHYRMLNSPGFFKNQRTAHNNYQFTSWYQSRNKRYNNFLVLLGNKLRASENGGIRTDANYLDDPEFSDRFGVPVKLGNDVAFSRNPFGSAEQVVGNRYGETSVLLRQQYDLGRKDSIVTDTTVIPLFFPRLRFEHTVNYNKQNYEFRDFSGDTAFYQLSYAGSTITGNGDTLMLVDNWNMLSNDFSIYQFPDARNQQQFFKVGLQYQWIRGELYADEHTFYNLIAHGEYRNRSRNQKWDIEAFGRLWANGRNAGDYHAHVSLQRLISSRLGSLQVGFSNINRSPSFVYDQRSSFYLAAPASFNKENTTHLFARAINPLLRLQLGADYYLVGNYLYFTDFYKQGQQSALFNVLRLSALKTFKFGRYFNLYSEVYLQQKAGNSPVNIPLVFTRNRLAFEGNFYRNLHLSTGIEMRYHTPYKADNYSPVIGQFFYQDAARLENRPDVNAFLHFRIRRFRAYTRLENLNTVRFANGFEFKEHNFGAPDYPYPGLVFRVGIYWSFVN